MLKILYYSFLALLLSLAASWMLDNNGSILIKWLGYEVQSDILTGAFLLFLAISLLAILLYFLTILASLRFPWLTKIFFRRSYIKKLEKIILRHHQAFEKIAQLLLAIELGDQKSFKKLHKNLADLTKNASIRQFLSAKEALIEGNLDEAKRIFAKFSDEKPGKILLLKIQMQIANRDQDNLKAIAYGKQILELEKENFDVACELLSLYRKTGNWHLAKHLIAEYGVKNFRSEIQKHDIAITNTALADEAYLAKKYLAATKYSKIAVQSSGNFLPANEIMIKSMIKMGMRLRAIFKIKSLWRDAPHYRYGKIYNFLYRKNSIAERIKALRSLFAKGPKTFVEDLLLADIYFHSGDLKTAKELLLSYLKNEKSQTAYLLLANVEKRLGDEFAYQENLAKSQLFTKNSTYSCSGCGSNFSKWKAVCQNCGGYDLIEWNF